MAQGREGALATCSLRPEQPQGSPRGRVVQALPAKAGDAGDSGSIPGSERSPGEGNGNPLQYSCPENSMERRSLAGYGPWGHKESDTTEQITHTSRSIQSHTSPTHRLMVFHPCLLCPGFPFSLNEHNS